MQAKNTASERNEYALNLMFKDQHYHHKIIVFQAASTGLHV